MFNPTIQRIFGTALQLLNRRRALAIFAGLYAALLATLYGFATTREATLWQVLLTLLFVALAPLEFFTLQAAIIDYARYSKVAWRRTLSSSWKLAVVTLPVVILGVVLFVILNRWQLHFPAPAMPISSWSLADSTWPIPSSQNAPQPMHWPTLTFSTLRWLLLGVSLPLITIHLWIEAANQDWGAFVPGEARAHLRRIGQVLARAFAPESVLTYTVGLILFALIPYALLFMHLPVKGARTDFVVFIARLGLVFLLTLFGWVLAITTLARVNGKGLSEIDEEENTFLNLELQAQSQ